MSVEIRDPRYNLSIGLKYSNDNYSRTFSYVNMAIGGSSSGYSPQDIYEFSAAVASLSGGNLNTVNINAQYPLWW